MRLLVVVIVLGAALAENSCTLLNLLPMPINCTMTPAEDPLVVRDPCSLLYKLVAVPVEQRAHYHELLEHLQKKTFGCAGANELHVGSSEEML